MTIQVSTARYVASHGKAPKGRGLWAFIREESRGQPEEVIFTPSNLTLREATALAKKVLKQRGWQDATIHVAP